MTEQIIPYENFHYKDNEIGIDDVSITYVQGSDCTQDEDGANSITISCLNNGCARFLCIKTERWSFDNIDSFVELLKDFKKRALID